MDRSTVDASRLVTAAAPGSAISPREPEEALLSGSSSSSAGPRLPQIPRAALAASTDANTHGRMPIAVGMPIVLPPR